MRKVYKLENLDCANCAAKMEDAIKEDRRSAKRFNAFYDSEVGY